MAAFITVHEIAIAWFILAVPTGVAFLRYRRRKRRSDAEMGGCLGVAVVATLFGAAVVILGLADFWRKTQPDNMLSRFLKVDDQSEFRDLRSYYSEAGIEYTAWIYFQTSERRMLQLVADLEFKQFPAGRPGQAFDFAGFSSAPPLPPPDEAVVYFRDAPENYDLQYLVTTRKHDRAWFVSIDY